MNTMQKRLQRILAEAGIASRRSSEELIRQGRVAINGQVATLGTKADPEVDEVTLDGQPLLTKPKTVLALHKPRGVVTTRQDPQGRKTVMDLLPPELHYLYPVGRLDYDTSGLLLMTNDGDLAHALAHPRHAVWKVYLATLEGKITDEALDQLRQGVQLEEGTTAPAKVTLLQRGPRSHIEIAIRQGWNRQIRRMAGVVGYPVAALHRIAIGGLKLGDLPAGSHRPLHEREIAALRREVGE